MEKETYTEVLWTEGNTEDKSHIHIHTNLTWKIFSGEETVTLNSKRRNKERGTPQKFA